MEKHSLDQLFEEKLKSFEAKPSPELWAALDDAITQKTTRRRLLYYRVSLAAASVTLLLLATFLWTTREMQEGKGLSLEKSLFEENFASGNNEEKNKNGRETKQEKEKKVQLKNKSNSGNKVRQLNQNQGKVMLADQRKNPLNDQKEKLLVQKDTARKQLKEDKIPDEMIAVQSNQNKEEKKIKVTVKVKISGKEEEKIAAIEPVKSKNILKKLRDLKNGEGENANLKIFGKSTGEIWASIGKEN